MESNITLINAGDFGGELIVIVNCVLVLSKSSKHFMKFCGRVALVTC